MSKLDRVKTFARSAREEYRGKGGENRSELILDSLLGQLAKTYNLDRSKIEDSITKFELHRQADAYSVSVRFAKRLSGSLGHFPWPLDCHKTIELCWPFPGEEGNIYCLEVELPWPCMTASF